MAHGAIHAARKKRERIHKEEEKDIGYGGVDLEKFEFKIMRSGTGAFKKPEKLHAVLGEEAISGWDLVEKLDDDRLRLKRLIAKRKDDLMLPTGIDPYRTKIGLSSDAFQLTMAGIMITLFLLIFLGLKLTGII